jgi:hypothetical protein
LPLFVIAWSVLLVVLLIYVAMQMVHAKRARGNS